MRFYDRSGRSARRFVFDRPEVPDSPAPSPEPAPPKAADLDNPYGRCYGKARSREDLRKNRKDF